MEGSEDISSKGILKGQLSITPFRSLLVRGIWIKLSISTAALIGTNQSSESCIDHLKGHPDNYNGAIYDVLLGCCSDLLEEGGELSGRAKRSEFLEIDAGFIYTICQ